MPTGDTTLKKRALLLFLCGDVEKNKKFKNNKNARCNYETIDLTKKHE
jgi:hypothetical protein